MKRPLLVAVLGCAAAGVVLLFAAGRTWGAATVRANGGARQHVAVSGHAVAPALPALGLALIALAVAMLAATGILRRVAGLLVVCVGGTALAVAFHARDHVGRTLAGRAFASRAGTLGGSRPAWWLSVAIAGAIAAAAGAAVVVAAGRWAGLGSRYDAPTSTSVARPPAVDDWDAIEQGQDPTVGG